MYDTPWRGTVRQIWLAPKGGVPPVPTGEVEAVAGMGLRGDRYFDLAHAQDPARQLTLIATEALDAAADGHGVDLRDGRHRRQVVVEGVPLNDLVDREFTVGSVRVRGCEWCEPCRHMATLAGEPAAVKALAHRGGLNAEILEGGPIRPGDPVCPAGEVTAS